MKKQKYVKLEVNEQDRIVPVVQFVFNDSIPDYCYCEPDAAAGNDIWESNIGCNVQPISNTVRVLIRPDVSKQEAKDILTKIIKLIDEDKHDWCQETENYLNMLKTHVADNKYRNAIKSKTSRQYN